MRRGLRVALLSTALLAACSPVARASSTVTVGAATPTATSCVPFGGGANWAPLMGFAYRNVPPFVMRTGDTIAFDLGAPNDTDIALRIQMVPAATNGGGAGDAPSLPLTTVVRNSQVPANPRGDATIGNYELAFTAEAAFNFQGGGLVLIFSQPAGDFALDATCTDSGLVAGGANGDSSALFYDRFSDPDETFPWATRATTGIGQVRIITADLPGVPPPPPPEPDTQSAPVKPTQPKRCKKLRSKGKRCKKSVSR